MEMPKNEGIVISCSKIRQKENGKLDVKTITSTFVLRHRDGMPVVALNPNRALVKVGNLFSFMHGPLAETSYFNDVHELPVLSPREYLKMRCRLPQQRLLDRALFAVLTSKSEFNDELYLMPDKQDHQKQYLAAITLSDILLHTLRGNPGMPGHYQLMFGELLNQQRLTRDFQDLCSALNLAQSWKYTLKARAESVLSQLRQGINLSARDLVLLLFDNVGFKLLGRQASYNQWIMINIIVVREKTLKATGFYKDDVRRDNQISRVPSHSWEEVIQDISLEDAAELAERIDGIKQDNNEHISVCVMENIRYVLDFQHELLSLDDQLVWIPLPRFDCVVSKDTPIRMDDLMVNGHPTCSVDVTVTNLDHQHSVLIPRNHIPDDVTDELGGNNILRHVDDAGIVGVGEDEPSASGSASNRYVENNATLQAVHEDLSEKSSVKGIIEYLVQSNKSQLKKWDDVKDNYPDTAEFPLAEVMIGCGCDGQPVVAMRRILAEDAHSGQFDWLYPDTMFVSFGGFHTIMKSLNASGEYFEELLKDIWLSFCDSWDKVKWILFPTNPRQREGNYSWCLLANYAVAAINLC